MLPLISCRQLFRIYYAKAGCLSSLHMLWGTPSMAPVLPRRFMVTLPPSIGHRHKLVTMKDQE